jgi:hypothetical protein
VAEVGAGAGRLKVDERERKLAERLEEGDGHPVKGRRRD